MTTIQDVAKAAGVSTATVSRVINGKVSVDPELAKRVRSAVDELNYRPNVLAKGLRARITTVVGVIVPDIENPFLTAVVRAVEDTAQRSGYSVMLCNSDEDQAKEARYLDILLDQRVAGVILAPASEQYSDVSALLESGIPVVAADRVLARGGIDTVTVQNVRGAEEATGALLDAGCERVAMINGSEGTTTAAQRLEGYYKALATHGMARDKRLVVNGGYRVQGGYAAARRLMGKEPVPDGLFVANNLMAVGALQALSEFGLRIPDDLAFASFDDLPWGTGDHRSLLCVAQPAYEMGTTAADMLLSRIRGDGGPVRHVVLDPVVRQDTNAAWTTDAVQRWTMNDSRQDRSSREVDTASRARR